MQTAILFLLVVGAIALPRKQFMRRDAGDDLCDPNPCGPDRTCEQQVTEDGDSYVRCGANVQNGCAAMNCTNGGFCVQDCNYARCQCPPTFNGYRCENSYDPCEHMNCANGGECVVETEYHGAMARCNCPEGYTGYDCQAQMISNDITLTPGQSYTLQHPAEGTSQYSDQDNIVWNFETPAANKEWQVTVEADGFFQTEECCDYLRINGGDGELVGDFRGCIDAGRHLATVDTQTMSISFYSDYSVIRRGVKVTVSLVNQGNGQGQGQGSGDLPSALDNCNDDMYGMQYGTNGDGTTSRIHRCRCASTQYSTTSYPDYHQYTTTVAPPAETIEVPLTPDDLVEISVPLSGTGNYDNNMNIEWVITSSNPGMDIVVSSEDFETENNFDFLYLCDGSRIDGVHTGELSRTDNSTCTLHFTSDGSVTRDVFHLTVELE